MNAATHPEIVARVDAAVADLTEEMLDFLVELVRLPTVNPPGDAYAECATLIAGRYRELGYQVELIPAEGLAEHSERYPRLNVLGRQPAAGKTLHFNGHFDVVPPGEGWSVPPFAALRRDGRVYGRGTADQKAGLAASLYAVEALRRAGFVLEGAVEQSATVDEESGGFAGVAYLCQRGLIQAGRTDFVVITEPLGHDRICLGHRGVYWFEVTAHGRIAHGSMPSLGVSAADLMADLIVRINRELKPLLADRLTSVPVEPPLARRPSLNINSLHGGQLTDGLQSPCVIDVCQAVFDRRFIEEESFDQVRSEVATLIEQANTAGDHFELRDLMIVHPVQTSRQTRLVRVLEEAIAAVVGRPAALIASPGTYDQKHVQRIGGVAECVAYGPGILELAHQPDEYVEVDHLLQSARVMALTALDLLGWHESSRRH